jgi:hypothetical protein
MLKGAEHQAKKARTDYAESESDVHESVIRAFETDYKDVGLLGGFSEYLEACGRQWSKDEDIYYAPYGTIFQSSGMGKTRLLRQFAEAGNTLLYINVNDPACGSYPRPHHGLHTYFTGSITVDTSEIERLFQLRLVSFIEVLLEHLDTHAAHTVKSEVRRVIDMLWGKENRPELEEAVKDKDCSTKLDVNMWVKDANELSQELLKNYQNKTLLQIELELKNCLEEKFRRVCDIFVEERSDRYVHVILAFDEARTMINTKGHKGSPVFTGIRRGLRSLPSGFFCIFTDTTSNLANFAPHSGIDPSLRPRLQQEHSELFPPFFAFPTFDMYAPSPDELLNDTLDCSAEKITRLFNYGRIAKYGRPLWNVLFCAGLTSKELEQFAKRKLFSGKPRIPSGKEFSCEEALALASLKVAISLHTVGRKQYECLYACE